MYTNVRCILVNEYMLNYFKWLPGNMAQQAVAHVVSLLIAYVVSHICTEVWKGHWNKIYINYYYWDN